jgi:uncharacterized repeat protein (TIGR01451 family)
VERQGISQSPFDKPQANLKDAQVTPVNPIDQMTQAISIRYRKEMPMKTQHFRLFSFSLLFALLLSGSVRYATAQSGQPAEQTARSKPASPSPEYVSGLTAQKAVDKTLASRGESVNYTISVNNIITTSLTSVVITDTIPTSLTYLEGSLTATHGDYAYQDGVITWTGPITAGLSLTVTYGAQVSTSAVIGAVITNTAVIHAGGETYIRSASFEVNKYQIFMPCLFKACVPFVDDFSDPSSGWLIENYPEYSTAYLNEEYQILVKAENYMAFNWLDFGESDYRVEVDARPAGHLDGSLGLVFGGSDSGFYLFQLSNGGYGMWRIEMDIDPWIWTTLIVWTDSPAIHSGSLTNRLKVVRKGASIELYANDQLLATLSDGTYNGSLLGVEAGTVPANFDGRFDNFVVYTGNCIDTPTAGLAADRAVSFFHNGIKHGTGRGNSITPDQSRSSWK